MSTAHMSTAQTLGLTKLEAVHYYVQDLARSRRFYTERMDFAETHVSSAALEGAGKQRSAVFEAGDCKVLVSEPAGEGGRAWRYLRKHPSGIGTLIFGVEDIAHTFAMMEARGGTPISDVQHFTDDGGSLAMFSITTPFGDTTFRFVQRDGYRTFLPGMERLATPRGGQNEFGVTHIDHVTSNFQTMKPALLWMEHVMGFEPFWKIQFHTTDVEPGAPKGSGLRSQVMWEPGSGVKFANNEPWRPFFKSSQINLFGEDHRGDGVQHLALAVGDILTTVKGLRARGVEFMETPGSYYDMLPERIARLGIERIDEPIDALRELGVLLDGEGERKYMLQIFLKEAAGLYRDPKAGPFFYEIIQRKGDRGFGGGNFRALFESIEREQQVTGRL